ncbi:plantaricin C family lantibiotic [Clostridium sp. FP2]|uniref:plantaricin C family lantibiotic n=1 Tax=Clostridium sp. FP2 TaxID=2724481 RepID=UPI001CCE793F|nr:plantaricin C family lantibiotic [Clostridium sp. FP2]MBZ9626041.1 plantaricin C family lantibiotic [Clostridium sp. FP2]
MSIIKNPLLRNAKNYNEDLASGNLLKEITDNQLETISGGTNDWLSKKAANMAGLGNNYGRVCTVSAECDFTNLCGDTK